jgi:hypothetical protein
MFRSLDPWMVHIGSVFQLGSVALSLLVSRSVMHTCVRHELCFKMAVYRVSNKCGWLKPSSMNMAVRIALCSRSSVCWDSCACAMSYILSTACAGQLNCCRGAIRERLTRRNGVGSAWLCRSMCIVANKQPGYPLSFLRTPACHGGSSVLVNRNT